MSNVWFISDLHINHHNLIEFRNTVHGTNFRDTVDMNLKIIENCNNLIHKRDSVWCLGDIGFGRWDHIKDWLDMLPKAHWKMIGGNHDTCQVTDYLQFFKRFHGCRKTKGFMMSHIPVHPQELAYRNWPYNVHGHIHHKERNLPEDMYFNANVDVNDLKPVHLDTILKQFGLPHGG